MPLTSSDLAAAAVAENREEMFSAVYDLTRGLREVTVILNDPATPFRLKQAAVKGALGHVWTFFRKFADFEEAGLNWPLETLDIALMDLELGTQPELLKPRRTGTGGTPPMSYAKQTLAHHAAFVLGKLMDLGMDQKVGAQAVAKEIGQAGISLSGGKKNPGVTADLVIRWREQLNAGPGAMNDFIVEVWRRHQKQKDRKPSGPGSRRGSQVDSPAARIVLKRFRQRMERLAANLKT